MIEILAIGGGSHQQCRHTLDEGEEVLLGRAPRSGWAVPWDRLVSREHALLRLESGRLRVTALPTARNPVLLHGAAASDFTLEPGGEFRIGETTFYFGSASDTEEGSPVAAEHVLGDEHLSSQRFSNPASCLHALCKMPDLIARSKDDAELAEQVVELLLDSTRGALASAVLRYEGAAGDPLDAPMLMRWGCRDDTVARFRPSRRLIRSAMTRERSVVHLWSDESAVDDNFTMNNDLDWAFCTPIPAGPGERWCLYVSGRRRFAGMREVASPEDLIGELRAAELVARFIGAVRRVRTLEQQHVEMRRFFSPAVIETLANRDTADALAPRSGPVSVLFCDVRGFSRKVEAARDLHALLAQVSQALSVMTRSILKYEGVIADFQGDAALGFWGWPADSGEGPLLACRAALAIHDAFTAARSDPASPLHGFDVGIGLGHGRAIAGRIGSLEQIKVGVFGPVVNLASRLQDMTKQVGVPILLDEATAAAVKGQLGEGSLRRLGRFRPPGVESPAMVYALGTPGDTPLSPADLHAYDAAVTALGSGDWAAASGLLAHAPAADPCAAFLRGVLEGAGAPPANWDGVLSLERAGSVSFKTSLPTLTRVDRRG